MKKIKKDIYEENISEEMGNEMAAEYERELVELGNSLQALKTALQSAVTPETVYSYLQELLTYYESNDDELQKMLFDKLIEKIEVYDDRIIVTLVVFPFARIGDSESCGQPKYSLSLNITRKDLKHQKSGA